MDYEIVQQHEYQDIYRLCYGVLLIVNKYKKENYDWSWSYTTKNKKNLKKVDGLKNCYSLIQEISVHSYSKNDEVLIPNGSVIFEHHLITPISNRNEFYYELKTTGSCFSGNYKEFNELLELAKSIMNTY